MTVETISYSLFLFVLEQRKAHLSCCRKNRSVRISTPPRYANVPHTAEEIVLGACPGPEHIVHVGERTDQAASDVES